tara:strand:- start:86 stop:1726 length:1641 start_codon:yes stop_codon:yes gene_type:complete
MAEFSWAYIDTQAVVAVAGPTGSVQYRVADSGGNTAMSGSTSLMFHTASNQLELGGSLSASSNISASAFYGDGSTLDNITATSISGAMGQFNTTTGTIIASGAVFINSPLTQITGALELTGSGQSLLTLHTRDNDVLKEIVFLKDGSPAASMQLNSSEHLFIENENTKDIILRTNNQNALRIIGSERKVIVGAVSKTSANAELDVEGSAIVSGSFTVSGSSIIGTNDAHVATFIGQITASQGATFGEQVAIADDKNLVFGTQGDAIIKYDEAGIDKLIISGSANGIELMGGSIGIDYPGGAVASGTVAGVGSHLGLSATNQVVLTTIPASDPFPYTGNIVGTGSMSIVSGTTQVLAVDSSDEGLGAVRGRMLHNISSAFSLTNGIHAKAGRYIDIGYNGAIVSNTLDYRNGFISPSSGRLVSVTYWFPAAAANQDQTKGTPTFELKVGDVNTLNGGTLDDSLSVVGQATASSWPGLKCVGGINVLNGQGTLYGANTTGSFAFGTGSAVGLRFYSGDSTNNNYPGVSMVTTVWEFDQLDPYISGSGN